ncbi:MAG: thioredoxin domain-containing protein [Spirochaetia bacterium]|nr:thioredoxin domain-containing protein [Spirochaetia bacterium]
MSLFKKISLYFICVLLFQVNAFDPIQKFISEYKELRIQKLDYSNAFTYGAQDPTLTIIEFYDYLCPYCSDVSNQLLEFAKTNKNSVKMVFMNFPLDQKCNKMVSKDIHPGACELSYAAYCANDQQKFIDFHEKLFELQMYYNVVTHEKILKLVESMKLDKTKFNTCMTSEKTAKFITNQINIAEKNNIEFTPTVFINGKKLKTIPDNHTLTGLLQHESFKE